MLDIFMDEFGAAALVEILWIVRSSVHQLDVDAIADSIRNESHWQGANTVRAIEYHLRLVVLWLTTTTCGHKINELEECLREDIC